MALDLLESIDNLADLLKFPQYHLHKLKGNLSGKFSIRLGAKTGFRLLLLPLDENEKELNEVMDTYFYIKAVCVEIEEVSNHYE